MLGFLMNTIDSMRDTLYVLSLKCQKCNDRVLYHVFHENPVAKSLLHLMDDFSLGVVA